jgi:hypothetical protein
VSPLLRADQRNRGLLCAAGLDPARRTALIAAASSRAWGCVQLLKRSRCRSVDTAAAPSTIAPAVVLGVVHGLLLALERAERSRRVMVVVVVVEAEADPVAQRGRPDPPLAQPIGDQVGVVGAQDHDVGRWAVRRSS